MTSAAFKSYEEAAQAYRTRLRALRQAPRGPAGATTRGAGEIPVEDLVGKAEEIADVSSALAPLSKPYLEAADPLLREGISAQLLAQVGAELQIAAELLELAEEAEAEPAVRPVTRALRGDALQRALETAEEAMAVPLARGIVPTSAVRRSPSAPPASLDKAREQLEQAAHLTTVAISQRVTELGGDMAFTLVFQTEWKAVAESAGLMSSEVAGLLDKVRSGVGAFIGRVVTTVSKTLVNVYDKLLALLGKDLAGKAREKIVEWLDSAKEKGSIELFEKLIGRLYRVDEFKKELGGWLDRSAAEIGTLHGTAAEVGNLADKFATFVGRLKMASDLAGLATFIKAPQVLVVLTGVRVALLAVLVYAGYDYIGYRQSGFPRFTRGVAEVIQKNLLPGA